MSQSSRLVILIGCLLLATQAFSAPKLLVTARISYKEDKCVLSGLAALAPPSEQFEKFGLASYSCQVEGKEFVNKTVTIPGNQGVVHFSYDLAVPPKASYKLHIEATCQQQRKGEDAKTVECQPVDRIISLPDYSPAGAVIHLNGDPAQVSLISFSPSWVSFSCIGLPRGQQSLGSYYAQLTTLGLLRLEARFRVPNTHLVWALPFEFFNPGLDLRLDQVEVQRPDAPVHFELKAQRPCQVEFILWDRHTSQVLDRVYRGPLSPGAPVKGTWSLNKAKSSVPPGDYQFIAIAFQEKQALPSPFCDEGVFRAGPVRRARDYQAWPGRNSPVMRALCVLTLVLLLLLPALAPAAEQDLVDTLGPLMGAYLDWTEAVEGWQLTIRPEFSWACRPYYLSQSWGYTEEVWQLAEDVDEALWKRRPDHFRCTALEVYVKGKHKGSFDEKAIKTG